MGRRVTARSDKVVRILKGLTEAGRRAHLFHFGDAVLGANAAKSEDQIKAPSGHARAGAHRVSHFQTPRHVLIRKYEAR